MWQLLDPAVLAFLVARGLGYMEDVYEGEHTDEPVLIGQHFQPMWTSMGNDIWQPDLEIYSHPGMDLMQRNHAEWLRELLEAALEAAGVQLVVGAQLERVGVLAGQDSLRPELLGGVLLGIVNTMSARYIGQYITSVILLGAAALTILIRPRGLLGR